MTAKFSIFKSEIVKRCKDQNACKPEFKRILESGTFPDIFVVLKDNFFWAINHGVIDVTILESVKGEAAESAVFVNENVTYGYLLAGGNATVKAWDNATVEAGGNATVEAGGNATVKAWDNATVEAGGNATVKAWDNATVEAWGNATVKAWGNATVKAWDNATVEAGGNAFISSYSRIECKISEHAIYRIISTNEIMVVDGSYTIKTV